MHTYIHTHTSIDTQKHIHTPINASDPAPSSPCYFFTLKNYFMVTRLMIILKHVEISNHYIV